MSYYIRIFVNKVHIYLIKTLKSINTFSYNGVKIRFSRATSAIIDYKLWVRIEYTLFKPQPIASFRLRASASLTLQSPAIFIYLVQKASILIFDHCTSSCLLSSSWNNCCIRIDFNLSHSWFLPHLTAKILNSFLFHLLLRTFPLI